MSEQSASGQATDTEWVGSASRQLHLLDQVIGLRAQLAEELVRYQMRLANVSGERDAALQHLHEARLAAAELRARIATAEAQLAGLKSSRTWRIGVLVGRPYVTLRRLARRRSV